LKAISLFASGGIGDLALRENGIEVVVANELLKDRAALFSYNFPEAHMFTGDIWKLATPIIEATKTRLNGEELDFLLATPPCQGMSKNGQGKIAAEVRAGNRPKIDPRNRLIIPTMNIVAALRPKIVMFENVPQMERTIIDAPDGSYVNIVEYVKDILGPDYEGRAEVVEFADYGVPQRRQRLITIFTRIPALKAHFKLANTFIPAPTHSKLGASGKKKWVSVRDVISGLPELDSKDSAAATSHIPFHNVPVLDSKKYSWIANTPPQKGAFDNQCINPNCGYQGNSAHGSTRNAEGINQANHHTPLYCEKCGELLPRPYTVTPDGLRLMKGFTSAYKRMSWDLPSSTLTTNLQYPSSDHKIHPEQHRVLSLHEAFMLHTLDKYAFYWMQSGGKKATSGLIRDVIGESIPPKGLSVIIKALLDTHQQVVASLESEEREATSLFQPELAVS
jgi:DNA (cytosine-5)-methyltransferase 1